jgi:hypothetical protein
MSNPGYADTPIIPGQSWRVHDGDRPQPPVVSPGQQPGPDRPGTPPSDAVVLFDGSNLDSWVSARDGASPAAWTVANGIVQVEPGTGDIQTKANLGDGQYHLEWAAPEKVEKHSQGRGNSGVFLMGLYELQVLDGFDNPTYADGITGAVYGQFPPLVNPCRQPGEWQSYDIIFTAPRFEGERLLSPAYVTLIHNGVLTHYHKALLGPTQHKVNTQYEPHPPELPLKLQDHDNLVCFRNIWYRPLGDYDEG